MKKNGLHRLKYLLLIMGFIISDVLAQVPTFEIKSSAYGISDIEGMAHSYGHGAAAADYDMDGDIDFYLTTDNGLANRLYNNLGNNLFEDIAIDLGLGITAATRAALWFDYDGDALLDLLVLGERCVNLKCGQPILIWLYKQKSDGSFTEVTKQSGLNVENKYDLLEVYAAGGLASADINNDGYLDLMITIWGGKVSLFLNNTDGTFSDISQSSGLGVQDKHYWQPMIHDFNEDGLMDIYCNVDFGENEFWLNQGNNHFVEIAGQIGVNSSYNEMGMTLGDYDNDGDLDIYATNITREYADKNQHNIFLKNDSKNGSLTFTESSVLFGVDKSGWDWGATFIDINNDGWQDLATTNGWNGLDWHPDRSKFWLNINGNFTDYSSECLFNDQYSATTLLAFDVDRDGDLDLLQTLKENENTMKPAVFYENQMTNHANSHYLVIKPRMNGANHFAIGTTVSVFSDGLKSTRLISAGTSFYGQEPAEAFFGMKNQETAEEISIEWPDGKTSVYTDIASDQVVTLNYQVINPPSTLQGSMDKENLVLIWLDESDNEEGFEVQHTEDPSFDSFTSHFVNANQTHFTHEGINLQKPSFYRVRAYNDEVSSLYSTILPINHVVSGFNNQSIVSLSVYPNPAKDHLKIRWIGISGSQVNIRIFDFLGRLQVNKSFNGINQEFEHHISHYLPNGLYLLSVQSGKKVEQRRFTIADH